MRYDEIGRMVADRFEAQSRAPYRDHVDTLKSIIQETAREKIPSKWKLQAYLDAITEDEDRGRIEIPETAKLALRIENGNSSPKDMREYNWKWKQGKKGRYVDIKMDRSMSKTLEYGETASVGGGPLTDFLRSLKVHVDVKTPQGMRTVALGNQSGPSRVPPGTVRKINDTLHVTDPFAGGKMMGASYSGGRVERTGLRIWRRMSETKGQGVTWMQPAWEAAKIFDTATGSAEWQQQMMQYKKTELEMIEEIAFAVFSEVL